MRFLRLCAALALSISLSAKAAEVDFRVLLNADNDVATGCTLSGMPGVDLMFVTRVETAATVTRTYRQACAADSLGAQIEIEKLLPAGFQHSSGQLLVESRIPFSAFGGTLPQSMRVGVEATQNALTHRELLGPGGSPVLFPSVVSRRRAVVSPGSERLIVIDGEGSDWHGLNPLFDGIAAHGPHGLRMATVFAYVDVEREWLYFRFDTLLSTDAPTAADDDYSRPAGEELTVPAPGVLANDSDPTGAPLTATPLSAPSAGSVTLNPDGSFTYTPADASSATRDSFEYLATNGTRSSNAARVTISVGNRPPAGSDDALTTDEDVVLGVPAPGVLANDSDPDEDALTAALLTPPAHGTVVLDANGGFTYTPATDYFGTDSFVYSVSDRTDNDTATVTITIAAVNDAPTVGQGAFAVPENSAAGTPVGVVTGSDVDIADQHAFAIAAGNTGGAFAIDSSSGAITVGDPLAIDFETTPEFLLTVRATDDGMPSRSGTATIVIDVTDVNEHPLAGNGAVTTSEDTPAAITLEASDPDGDPLSWTIVAGPAHGALSGTAPNLTFTPSSNYFGSDSVTFRVNDGAVDSNIAAVSISVVPVNDPPVAVADVRLVAEGGTIDEPAPGVLGNDSDVESPLTAVLDTSTVNGTLTLNADGSFTYVHDGSETLSDSFTYHANDGTADSAVVTVTITITPVDDGPVGVADAYVVGEGGTINGTTVLANDTDAENDALTAVLATGPAQAVAFTLNADGTFSYTHDGSETTSDSFTYRANDGTLDSSGVTVTITVDPVNDAPVAVGEAFRVEEGATLASAVPGVLGNDSDPDGPITAVLGAGPAHAASFALNADGSFTYAHDGSESTSDSFTYHASDGALDSATVMVSIAIDPVNDAPLAVADGGYTVAEGGSIAGAPSVLGNDTDPEGSALNAVLVSAPARAAAFVLHAGGTFDYVHDGSETMADSFTYRANDGALDSVTVTVTIAVTPVNDAPTAVADSGAGVTEGGTLTGAATVLGNDTDAEGNALTAVLDGGPSNASSFALHADGTYDYTHDGSETTADSFTYHAHDGLLDSNVVSVSITVSEVNDAPQAVDDAGYAVDEGGTIPGASVLVNDTDPEGTALVAVLVDGPSNAAAFTLNGDGTFSYAHDGSETTADSFTYKANDGVLDSNVVTVTIGVNAVNDAPIAQPDTDASVDEGGSLTGAASVLANDTDDEGDVLSVIVDAGPAHATSFTLYTDGTFDYTHDGSEASSDTFTYHTRDGVLDSNVVAVSISINPVNDAPAATPDAYTVNESGALNETAATGVLANDSDPDSTPAALLVAGPSHASSFMLNADGSFTYVHDGSETAFDAFTYKANDGALDSATVAVSITVNAVNDAPVAVANGYAVDEGGTLTAAASVLGNDSDAEGNTLTAVLVRGPVRHSAFTLHPDGTFDYTHDGGESRSDSFRYRASDGSLDSNIVTVTIAISPVNDAPVAVDDSGYTIPEGGEFIEELLRTPSGIATNAAGTSVLINDFDAEGNALTATVVSLPAHSTYFAMNADGSFSYTHDGGEEPTDTFTYRVNDGALDSNVATVTINLVPVNDGPTAADDSGASVDEGGTISGATSVLANDTDPDGDVLSAVIVTGPAHSTAFTLHPDGTFDYTHDGGETTSDSFTYKASDGPLESNTVTVAIAVNPVNDAPVALPDGGYAVAEGGIIAGAASVLINDTDADGAALTAVLDAGPSHAASFTLYANGTFDYEHDGGESTTDSFTYQAFDSALGSNVVTVSIGIDPVNDPPTNTLPGGQTTAEDMPLILSGAAAISIADLDAAGADVQTTLTATNGTVTLSGAAGLTLSGGDGSNDAAVTLQGTVAAINAALDGLIFTPAAEYNGPAEIAVITNDLGANGSGPAGSDTDSLAISVTIVNDAPVVTAADPAVPHLEGGGPVGAVGDVTITDIDDTEIVSATIAITGNLMNGADSLSFVNPTGALITASYVSATGTMVLTGPASLADFELALEAVRYNNTADHQYYPDRTITWSVNDGGVTSAPVQTTLTLQGVNNAPSVSFPGAPFPWTTSEDVAYTAPYAAIWFDDREAENGPLPRPHVRLSITATNGVVTLATTDGLDFGMPGGIGDGVADAEMVLEGTILELRAAANGLQFIPAPDYSGEASIEFVLDDLGVDPGPALQDTATMNVNVNARAEVPSISGTTTMEDVMTGSGLAISPDSSDGAAVTHYAITAIAGGLLYQSDGLSPISNGDVITAAQGAAGLRFMPAPDRNSAAGDTFEFTVQALLDAAGTGISPGRIAVITVTEVNDAPVANPDFVTAAGLITRIPIAAILANDSPGTNEGSQSLELVSVTAGAIGTVGIDGADVVFKVPFDFYGPMDFTYLMRDNGTTNGAYDPLEATSTVTVNVP